MKYISVLFCCLLVVFLPLSSSATPKAKEAVLLSLHFQRIGDGREQVEFRFSEKVVPKFFELDGEKPRLVFDFENTRGAVDVDTKIRTWGRNIKQIRTGFHIDPLQKTRVVFDLAKEKVFDIDQQFDEKENILRVIVYPHREGNESSSVSKEHAEQDKTIAAQKSPHDEEAAPQKKSSAPEQAAEQENQMERPAPPQTGEGLAGDELTRGPAAQEEGKTAQEAKADAVQIPDKGHETAAPVAVAAEVEQGAAEVTVEEKAAGAVAARGREFEKFSVVESAGDEEEFKGSVFEQAQETEVAGDKGHPVLSRISFETSDRDKEMVLFKLNGFFPPLVFASDETDLHVVCEFLGATVEDQVAELINAQGKFIKKIRITSQQDPRKVRAILDLSEKYTYDLKQVFFKDDNLFVVMIHNLGEK